MINESSYFGADADSHFSRAASVPALYQAWRKVRANRGTAGARPLTVCWALKSARLLRAARRARGPAVNPIPVESWLKEARYPNTEREPTGKTTQAG